MVETPGTTQNTADSSPVEALIQRSESLLLLNKSREALQAAEDALVLEPNNIRAVVAKAAIFWDRGRFQECAAWYQRAIELANEVPDSALNSMSSKNYVAWLWASIGTPYLNSADYGADALLYQKEVDAFDEAVHLCPQFAWAWWGLGVWQNRLGLKDKARESIVKALELDPGNVEFQYSLEKVDRPDAIDIFEDATDLYTSRQFEMALAAVAEALEIQSDHYWGLYLKSVILESLGDEARSIQSALACVEVITSLANQRELSRHERQTLNFLWSYLGQAYMAQAAKMKDRKAREPLVKYALCALERLSEFDPDDVIRSGLQCKIVENRT